MLGENVERNEEHLGREGVKGNALCAGVGRVGWGGGGGAIPVTRVSNGNGGRADLIL